MSGRSPQQHGTLLSADLHCWALSPPGGLMSTNLSRLVQPFVTSVIVGKDVVPRVSVVNLGRLIDQMVSTGRNSTDSFSGVMQQWLLELTRQPCEHLSMEAQDCVPVVNCQELGQTGGASEAADCRALGARSPLLHVRQLLGRRHSWQSASQHRARYLTPRLHCEGGSCCAGDILGAVQGEQERDVPAAAQSALPPRAHP